MNLLFDTHAHLTDEAYDEDRAEFLADVENNLAYVMNVGCNLQTARQVVEMSKKHSSFYAAVALHPSDFADYTDALWQEICSLATEDKVRAIGETGLDYYWDKDHHLIQQNLFHQHIDLALSLNKPLIIHDRDAHQDTFDILKNSRAREVGGVVHAFSGSVEMMRELVKLNFSIGLGGVVTFKNANKMLEVAKEVPLEYLVLETDCPYLTPVPFRGKRNHPKYAMYTAQKIAEIKGLSLDELLTITLNNGKRLFSIV